MRASEERACRQIKKHAYIQETKRTNNTRNHAKHANKHARKQASTPTMTRTNRKSANKHADTQNQQCAAACLQRSRKRAAPFRIASSELQARQPSAIDRIALSISIYHARLRRQTAYRSADRCIAAATHGVPMQCVPRDADPSASILSTSITSGAIPIGR